MALIERLIEDFPGHHRNAEALALEGNNFMGLVGMPLT
jgi:hypothetical protein